MGGMEKGAVPPVAGFHSFFTLPPRSKRLVTSFGGRTHQRTGDPKICQQPANRPMGSVQRVRHHDQWANVLNVICYVIGQKVVEVNDKI